MLKVEPGRKMKFDPEVWTRIDPAGRTLVVDDVVVPVPVVVVEPLAAAPAAPAARAAPVVAELAAAVVTEPAKRPVPAPHLLLRAVAATPMA